MGRAALGIAVAGMPLRSDRNVIEDRQLVQFEMKSPKNGGKLALVGTLLAGGVLTLAWIAFLVWLALKAWSLT